MSQPQVRATICVQSETFHQTYEEPVGDSSTNDPSQFYEQLIAANDRLRASISKTLTDFVNKARLEQQEHGEKSKRKLTQEDDEEQEEEEDVELSDEEEEDVSPLCVR